jgi:MFS family permease
LDKKAAANLSSNIVSTLQAGCFLGALVAYYIADKFGRRPSLLAAGITAILGIIIQTASDGHVYVLIGL